MGKLIFTWLHFREGDMHILLLNVPLNALYSANYSANYWVSTYTYS